MSAEVRARCEFCGRRGRWVPEDPRWLGRVPLGTIAAGWSVAPFSSATVHCSGRHGDLWSCPTCTRRLSSGALPMAPLPGFECTERRVTMRVPYTPQPRVEVLCDKCGSSRTCSDVKAGTGEWSKIVWLRCGRCGRVTTHQKPGARMSEAGVEPVDLGALDVFAVAV